MTDKPQYLVDLALMIGDRDNQSISDVELSAMLNHNHPNAKTTLLTTTIDGESYSLTLSDHICFFDQYGNVIAPESTQEERFNRLVEAWSINDEELTNGMESPYFEWVSSDGSTVCPYNESLTLDPQKAIDGLVEHLQTVDSLRP